MPGDALGPGELFGDLRVLDAELAASIERQQRMRRELAAILNHRAAIDLPADFTTLADGLPKAQRSLLLAYSSILTPRRCPLSTSTSRRRAVRGPDPVLRDLDASSRPGGAVAQSVVVQALVEFYNEAHLDVLRRVHALLAQDDPTAP